MKNIIVVLVLLLASQVLVAGAHDLSPKLNDPNDCGSLGKSILPYILPFSTTEEDSKCGNILDPEKPEVVEKPFRAKDTNPEICDFAGACGEVDYDKENSLIIKVK